VIGISAAAMGCSSDRAERERAVAALRSQLDELRKGQEANTRALAQLAGQMKALDAQSAFVLGEVKASSEERARVKATIDETSAGLRDVQGTVDKLSKQMAAPPAPVEASPEQLYTKAMASVTAEEYAQALAAFRELTTKFPQHALASNAQYWIGETLYRQQDFSTALVEFRRVIDGYPTSPQVPEALLKIGFCHRALKDQEGARATWEQLTKDYPGTNAATQASSLLATLGGTSAPSK